MKVREIHNMLYTYWIKDIPETEDIKSADNLFSIDDWLIISTNIHKENGPAILSKNGLAVFYLNGNRYDSEQDYLVALRNWKMEQLEKSS